MQIHDFPALLKQLTSEFTPVVAAAVPKEAYCPIDLTLDNNELEDVDVASAVAMDDYIAKLLKDNKANIAYGGYLEKRAIYQRSPHFNQQDPETERNIHLGIDLWIDAGTEVLAVLDGSIHSFKDNTNFGDYGPTIIVEHRFDGQAFYTLYGHLSRTSLDYLDIGQTVKQGQVIAQLGTAEVNGDYPPHLHFQVIRKIGEYQGDYPGVSSQKDLDYYAANCPDPNLLLKIN